jgi:gamma-glutamyl hydrolase
VYGLQWHPEKPQYEWDPNEVTNHSKDAVTAMQYMSEFLVSEARKSNHTYPSQTAEDNALIYNCMCSHGWRHGH